ncbi:MAG: GNAT family N-acetyltransferase [Ferrovibrio sp.]
MLKPIEIGTDHLLLRTLQMDDATDKYLGWLNDPEVNRYLETRWRPQTMDSIRDFISSSLPRDNEHLFGMFMQADKRHIGNIKVGPRKPHQPYAEVSLFIGDKSAWGKGYATEAIAAVSNYAFNHMDVIKLGASAYSVNRGSIRAFCKAGYQIEGTRQKHYLLDGAPADLVEVGLCKPL